MRLSPPWSDTAPKPSAGPGSRTASYRPEVGCERFARGRGAQRGTDGDRPVRWQPQGHPSGGARRGGDPGGGPPFRRGTNRRGHVVFGNVIHTDVRDMYLARVAAINGGLPVETPAFTLNRLCGSGLQAIVSAAQAIQLGDTDAAVAGGAEVMSRGQYWLPG